MSMENLHAFLDKSRSDEKLKARLSEMGSPEDVINLGKEWGYEFSANELEQATKERLSSGELKQDDLENISGGTVISVIFLTVTVCGKVA